MVIEFEDEAIRSLVTTGKSSDKRYEKFRSDKTFLTDLKKVVFRLQTVPNVEMLKSFGNLHYEKLKYGLSGMSSVRVGYRTKYRLLFTEFDGGIRIKLIEISEHYGDK